MQAFPCPVQDVPPLVGQLPDVGHVKTLLLVPHSVCPGAQFPAHCPALQTSVHATVAVVHAPVPSQVCTYLAIDPVPHWVVPGEHAPPHDATLEPVPASAATTHALPVHWTGAPHVPVASHVCSALFPEH
jgi:hypothetical protein